VITIDISDKAVDMVLEMAEDAPGGDMFTVRLGEVDICINFEQLKAIYAQVRPWFEDDAT
jgi:hypothetical protein